MEEQPTRRDEGERPEVKRKQLATRIALFVKRRSNAEKAIALGLLFIASLWLVPYQCRNTLAQVFVGFGILLGLYFISWRRVKVFRKLPSKKLTSKDSKYSDRQM